MSDTRIITTKNAFKNTKYPNIKTSLTSQGYHIKITSVTKEQLNEIMNDLTVIPHKLDATKEDMEKSKFSLYQYSKDRLHLIIPRYYGIYKFGTPQEEMYESEEIDIAFTQTLRPIQEDVTEKCLKYMKNHGGGLLSVPCGFGKTVCALYIAQRLGLKTLVVVHKSFLINQWIEKAKEFLNIDDNQFGIIRQKKCDVKGKDIVFGMIHTIAKRQYDQSVFDGFGLVIYDEAHYFACKFFSKALMKTSAQYTLALTATPYRGDGMIKVMYWFAGGTIYRERMKMNKNVVVKIINHRSSDKKLFSLRKKWYNGKMRTDTGKMTTNICKIANRNNKIIEMINHIRRTEPNRKILVLSGRKQHLAILKKGVDMAIQHDIELGIIDEDEIYSCYYIGDTKPCDRQDAEERGDIIFATYDMASVGLDIKRLNTVFLSSPKKDVVQSIGRVMRKILETGDMRPMVVDFADDINTIDNWLRIRNTIYSKCKYEVQNYYLNDKKFLSSLEYHGEEVTKDDMHHKDGFINRTVNNHNISMNNLKNDIKKFREICLKIEAIKAKTTTQKLDPLIEETMYRSSIEEETYKILDEVEYTDLKDILYVPKLTVNDFDRKIVKDVEDNEVIDLDRDVGFDEDEIKNEVSVLQSFKTNKTVIPTKKLFR